MKALTRTLALASALAAATALTSAADNDTLRSAAKWTQEFLNRLPAYQAHMTAAIRTGQTTDKGVMDSLRREVHSLAVLLMKRDSVLLAGPGSGWPVVAGLEDDLALAEAAPPNPGFLVQLAYQHRRFVLRFVSLSGPDSAGIEAQARKRIESTIVHWGERVDEKLWPSLQLALLENGIALGPFSGGDAFASAMTGYLESRPGSGDERALVDAYQRFKLFWGGDVRNVWLPILVWSGRLNPEALKTLDRLVDRWDRSTMPRAWWDDVYTAAGVIGVLAVAGAVFSFWRRRRRG